MNKKYIVRLSHSERQFCKDVIKKLAGSSQKVKRAQILLKADVGGPARTDLQISESFDCRVQTVESIRKQFVLDGFEAAIERKKRAEPPTPPKLDGKQEAKLISMRLGKATSRLWSLDSSTTGGSIGRIAGCGFDQP